MRISIPRLAFFTAACTSALVLTPVQSRAALDEVNPSSGNALYENCISDEPDRKLACAAYLRGIADGFLFGAVLADMEVCFLEGNIPYRQSFDIVVKYLKEHPETRHEQAGLLFAIAMANAFPCSDPPQESE